MKKDNSHNIQLAHNNTDKKYDGRITMDQSKYTSNTVEKDEKKFSFRSVDKDL